MWVRFPLPAPDTETIHPKAHMFSPSNRRVLGLALVAASFAGAAFAGAPSNCDKIAQDVRESVEKSPSKVLMIVEDALVINETCACEVVKAALIASKADVTLGNQIVQTAVAVAPKMTPIIIECANTVVPGAGSTSDPVTAPTSAKGGKNVNPDIQPPKEGRKGRDFTGGGSNGGLRGVYLMAPAVGGFLQTGEPEVITVTERIIKVRPQKPTPVSPSVTEPKDPKVPGFTP
jgi:hypothetical protein